MSQNRAICPVSFDLNDEHESALYEHAKKKGKFSPYIKRLIWLDMMNTGRATISAMTPPMGGSDDDDGAIMGLI